MVVFLLISALMFGFGSQFQDVHKLCEDDGFKADECKVHKALEDLNEK